MDLNHEEKLSLLQELIRIASADGEHRDEEYDFLHAVAQMLEVEPMEMEALFTKSVPFKPPQQEARRIVAFVQLLRMVWSDGELDLNEEYLLRELGMKLGLAMQAVQGVIERSKTYDKGRIPDSEIIHIFQVHHN
jgi:uncharacterized tellurite resistance protein B-like protein